MDKKEFLEEIKRLRREATKGKQIIDGCYLLEAIRILSGLV